MGIRAVLLTAAFTALGTGVLSAQVETPRTLCDVADPGNNCPGEDCSCVDDTLEIVFAGQLEDSVFKIENFQPNLEVQSHVLLDVVSTEIRGYSFGVAHDGAFAGIRPGPAGLNTIGTPSEIFAGQGFTALGLVPGGYRMAVVLSFTEPVVLPIARTILANATYTLSADPGAGTTISLSEDLGMPPTQIVLTIDTLSVTDMGNGIPPFEENLCADGMDNDGDMLIDGDDPDCVVRNGVSRVPKIVFDGIMCTTCEGGPVEDCATEGDEDGNGLADCEDPACVGTPDCPPPEDCATPGDEDGNGLADCEDPACVGTPDCPPPEDCTTPGDEDGNGLSDCEDPACVGTPDCPPPEDCDTVGDEDGNGLADCEDPACPACPPTDCLDYAFYFGGAASETDLVVDGTSYPISMRNASGASGFQLGVKVTTEGEASTWEFSGSLGGSPDVLVELLIADAEANSQLPVTPNKATSAAFEVVPGSITVVQGSGITFAGDGDLLLIDTITTDSGVGGPGFTVGYIADINNDGNTNVIAATPAEGCPVNEILVVSLGDVTPGNAPFSRGDADGDGKLNVVDAVLIIQNALGNLPKRFDCDDMLDTNDDGTVDVADGIPPLTYVFQRGPALPDPFRTCAVEAGDDDGLGCVESNCSAP